MNNRAGRKELSIVWAYYIALRLPSVCIIVDLDVLDVLAGNQSFRDFQGELIEWAVKGEQQQQKRPFDSDVGIYIYYVDIDMFSSFVFYWKRKMICPFSFLYFIKKKKEKKKTWRRKVLMIQSFLVWCSSTDRSPVSLFKVWKIGVCPWKKKKKKKNHFVYMIEFHPHPKKTQKNYASGTRHFLFFKFFYPNQNYIQYLHNRLTALYFWCLFFIYLFLNHNKPHPNLSCFPFPSSTSTNLICASLIIYIINHAPADGKTKKNNPEGAPLDEPLWKKKNYVIYYKPPKKIALKAF